MNSEMNLEMNSRFAFFLKLCNVSLL